MSNKNVSDFSSVTALSDSPEPTQPKNALLRLGSGVLSFIVGVSIFFILKLVVMVPLNIAAMSAKNEAEQGVFEGVGSLAMVFLVYLAYKLTKKINAKEIRKVRITARIAVIAGGFVSMLLTTVVLVAFK